MFHRMIYYFFLIGLWGLVLAPNSTAISSSNTTDKPKKIDQAPRKLSLTEKPKLYFKFTPPPAAKPDEFSAVLTASQITVQFSLPKLGYAQDVISVQYQLTGIGLAAVEATAFENPEYFNRWVYTTSAFPKDMQITFNYLGAAQQTNPVIITKKRY